MPSPFNNKKYVLEQHKAILERVNKFDRLYLEIGGRLSYDGHAARVLPGYNPKNKINLLKKLGKKAGLIYCMSSKELEKGTTWSDTGLTLDKLALKETKELESVGIETIAIVASQFSNQKKVVAFEKQLNKQGKKMFFTKTISGYPNNMSKIFGKKGFDAQPSTDMGDKKIILLTGAGAGSGKMFFGLSQIYKDNKQGISSGFAKFETFPVWNIPPNHEVNLAYDAATADLEDKSMIDKYYKKKYGVNVTNYNRDLENFLILKKIISKVVPKTNYMHNYHSPTEMGINMINKGIVNNVEIRKAATQEILRRKEFYSKKFCGAKKTKILKRMDNIIKKLNKSN